MVKIPETRIPDDYKKDWTLLAGEVFNIILDEKQKEIVRSVQNNKYTTVKSCHARGKDFVGAYLCNVFGNIYRPHKIINTAPSARQVEKIMMAEIKKIRSTARVPLDGEALSSLIKYDDSETYLMGFTAPDKEPAAWTGFHSINVFVIISEASGVSDETFDAIEGLLTGDMVRVLYIGNPDHTSGRFYKSFKDPRFKKFTLSALDSPNVLAKKTIIPGQVDYDWVQERVERWCVKIRPEEKNDEFNDFLWEGQLYRPDDDFRKKILGEFPRESESQLIPLRWIELANQRWLDWQENKPEKREQPILRLGVDVAGMGRDKTVFAHRYGNIVEELETFSHTDHMEIAGMVKNRLHDYRDTAFVDSIGEGAGIHSRLVEQGVNSIGVKFSESAKGLSDVTGERAFLKIRAYCYWALRDALDPKQGGKLALPPNDKLTQDLVEIQVKKPTSEGLIRLELKEDIKKRIGRSTDYGDSVAQTYYPMDLAFDDYVIVSEPR